MRATRKRTFEAAHRLPDHDGGCRRLHGHSYVVEVTVEGPLRVEGPQTGMVLDFGRIDDALEFLIAAWDHRTILWDGDPWYERLLPIAKDSIVTVERPPTAEFLAGYVAEAVQGWIDGDDNATARVVEVVVRETARGWATWQAT